MLLTVEGIYKDGKIMVAEKPAGVRESKVLVTFLKSASSVSQHRMVFGQFPGERMSSEEDFRIAEWHGEE